MKSINRRDLCKWGVLATTGLGSMPRLSARATEDKEKFTPWILVVYVSGGWDPSMVFDNKVGVDTCAQEPGWRKAKSESGINFVDHPTRPSVKDFFNRYGDHAVIVNGVSTGAISREQAIASMFGAIPDKRFRRCDWLSFYASMLNPGADMPHVVIDAPYMPGEYSPYTVRLTTSRIKEMLAKTSESVRLNERSESALLDFREAAFKTIGDNQNGASLDSEKLLTLYYQFLRNDLSIKRLKQINETLGSQRDDESDFARHGKIAIELFRNEYSQCVTIQSGQDNAWDTTRDHFQTQSKLYERLFHDLNEIFAYADDAGVLERTLVVVMSERGRAPHLNTNAGKSPWQYTSTLLWGPGLAGGQVIGSTDAWLRGETIDPIFGSSGSVTLDMTNIMAAIYLKTNAPGVLLLPKIEPLSVILVSE